MALSCYLTFRAQVSRRQHLQTLEEPHFRTLKS